jgi:hypothetical protein
MSALCVLWLGSVIAYVAAGARLNPYKPTWALIDEAVRTQQSLDGASYASIGPDAENTAMTELTNRIATMRRDQLQALIDRALALQQDDVAMGRAPQNLRYQWYSLVERAHGSGLLSAADWARYLSQGADGSLALLLRGQVTRGDPLVLAIDCNPVFGNGLEVSFDSDFVPTIAGHKVSTPNSRATSVIAYGHPSGETVVDLPPDLLSSLADGPQNADVTAVVNVRDKGLPLGPPVYSKTIILHGAWELLPASSPSITVDKTIQQQELNMMASLTRAQFAGNGTVLYIQANYGGLAWGHPSLSSSSKAYRVYIGAGGSEWEVGRAVASANLNLTLSLQHLTDGKSGRGIVAGELPPTVDVVIRPNDQDAVRTVGCTQTWRGEIVVPNVPVR